MSLERARPRRWLGAALGLALLACAGEPVPPPYGFGAAQEQRFRFEAADRTYVDGTLVRVQRYADVRLVAETFETRRTELALYLDRYYIKVEGAPGGTTELALSERGLAARSPEEGEFNLAPDDARPGGGTIRELRERPVAGCELGPDGAIVGTPWRSFDPVLSGIDLLDWILLGFPVLSGGESSSWRARRTVPQLGQYQLGLELPLFYERTGGDGEGKRIRVSGLVQRTSLSVAPNYTGALNLDHLGQVELGADGRVREAQFELRMRFNADSGGLVSSQHLVRIYSLDTDDTINSPSPAPDIFDE